MKERDSETTAIPQAILQCAGCVRTNVSVSTKVRSDHKMEVRSLSWASHIGQAQPLSHSH